jgi:hypothetical protein
MTFLVLSLVFCCHQIAKVLKIDIWRTSWKSSIWHIIMITPIDSVVMRLERSRVIMRSSWLVSSSDQAIQMAPMFPMVSNKTIEIHHARSISSAKSKERSRNEDSVQ